MPKDLAAYIVLGTEVQTLEAVAKRLYSEERLQTGDDYRNLAQKLDGAIRLIRDWKASEGTADFVVAFAKLEASAKKLGWKEGSKQPFWEFLIEKTNTVVSALTEYHKANGLHHDEDARLYDLSEKALGGVKSGR